MEQKRILVVDDDAMIIDLVRALLQRFGIEPITASNATDAARILRTPPLPDLLILDLMLPEVSGIEFLRQMRAKSFFDDLPVIVLSALVEPETIREALDAGADRYVTKPYIATSLVPTIQDVLRTGRRKTSSS